MLKKADDIRPGDHVIRNGTPSRVTRVSYQQGRHRTQVEIATMGSVVTQHFPEENLSVAPANPTWDVRWNPAQERYDINVHVVGEVEVRVNGEVVFGGAIKVPSERGDAVKEIA
jgi:hypothetical protein